LTSAYPTVDGSPANAQTTTSVIKLTAAILGTDVTREEVSAFCCSDVSNEISITDQLPSCV